MFWRARRKLLTPALFAAWLGYQIPTQLNFSWLPAAAPFWILLGASVVYCSRVEPQLRRLRPGRLSPMVAALGAALASALIVATVIVPYAAEQRFTAGLALELRGQNAAARGAIKEAVLLAPQSSEYATEAGDLSLRSGDIASARAGYLRAAGAGSADPSPYRSLAILDQLSGRRDEAIWAARQAVVLDPFNGEGRELLESLTAQRAPTSSLMRSAARGTSRIVPLK